MSEDQPTFLDRLNVEHDFPCAFTFKLIGEASEAFVERVTDAAHVVLPGVVLETSRKTTRSGRHMSLTATLTVPTAEDIVALYDVFSRVEGLKVML